MKKAIVKLSLRQRVILTIIITFFVLGHLVWDHFHGGIPTHYLLQDGDMPGIPNWLGGIILPFFAWFLLYRIHRRINSPQSKEKSKIIFVRFFLALLVAVLISICFTIAPVIIEYIMLSLFILAFFFPLYKAEYLLGYVIGSTISFGAIIPIGFGSILALLFFSFYKITRAVLVFIRSKSS